MAWLAIAVGVGAATSLAGIGISAATKPQQPDMASSSKELSNVNAELLPYQRQMQAASDQGGRALQYGYKSMTVAEARKQFGDLGLEGKSDTDLVYLKLDKKGRTGSSPKYVPKTEAVAEFGGYGTADVQSSIARQTAKNNLELAQKYDAQYIEEALKQQEAADPDGVKARQLMSELIQEQVNRPQNSPVSDMLNAQVQEQIAAANDGRLSAIDRARLDANVADALASRGGNAAGVDMGGFEDQLTSGFAGEQRQTDAARKAMGFLASGSSPEDIAYRREQQNLANLSAQVNGRTPQSQFASMSAAQTGPTPVVNGGQLATMPNNEAQAQGVAMQNWRTQMAQGNQTASWLSGVSSLMQLAPALGAK